MKRFTALILAVLLMFTLCACSSSSSTSDTSSSTASSSTSEATDTAEAEEEVTWAKNVDIIIAASAGGGTDVVGRALVQHINENSDYNLTVINNSDGSGVVAYETVRNADPDGETLLFFHTTMCIKHATGIYEYDPAEEFSVISFTDATEKGGVILVVPADSGIETLDEFIGVANDMNGELLFGVETGASSHIQAGMMCSAGDFEVNFVEAGPDTEKMTALVGGSIDACLVNANQAKQYVDAGMVTALATVSTDAEGSRNSILPDVPSFIEQGLDFVYGINFLVLGPQGMDEGLMELINGYFTDAALDPAVDEILVNAGYGMTMRPLEECYDALATVQNDMNTVILELGLRQD